MSKNQLTYNKRKEDLGKRTFWRGLFVCCVLPFSKGKGWVGFPLHLSWKGGALRRSLRAPWDHCELLAVWGVHRDYVGILPEETKGKIVAADGWADGSVSWDWPAPSGLQWKDTCMSPFCQMWTADSVFHTVKMLDYSCLGSRKPPGWTNKAQHREAKDIVKILGSRQQGEIGTYSKESRELQKDHLVMEGSWTISECAHQRRG